MSSVKESARSVSFPLAPLRKADHLRRGVTLRKVSTIRRSSKRRSHKNDLSGKWANMAIERAAGWSDRLPRPPVDAVA